MKPAELIAAGMAYADLTLKEFAKVVLIRDERTVRRWRDGLSPMPEVVRSYLVEYLR